MANARVSYFLEEVNEKLTFKLSRKDIVLRLNKKIMYRMIPNQQSTLLKTLL